ncbi:MAG: hypothetical protein WBP40_01160 [Candidatus Moraniibacteriota bacterium]
MLQKSFVAGMLLAMLFLGGCATNPRFATETPSGKITGEAACEVPQHWKALALEGVDTRSLTDAVVVQVRIPAQWIGDALGWFVESAEDSHSQQHVPRYAWSALVTDGQNGEKQFFPAIMKNPLTTPYLTVVINDPEVKAGQEREVYVLSGAYTRLLTTSGDRSTLPRVKDCLRLVDAEFYRSFPSRAVMSVAPAKLITSIRADFPQQSRQSDGKVYSLSPMALNPKVVGSLRQVTAGERAAERGATIAFSPISWVPTVVTGGIALGQMAFGEERYAGPFGERMYSAPEAKAALTRMMRGYNSLKGELETILRIPYSDDLSLRLDFEGRKSGWEIGEVLAFQIEEAWTVLERLKERAQSRRK